MKSRPPKTSASSGPAINQVCSADNAYGQSLQSNALMQQQLRNGPAISAAPGGASPTSSISAPERPGGKLLDTGDLDVTINGLAGLETLNTLSKGAEIMEEGGDFVSKMPGGTALGNGLAVVGAVNTALNHEASNTGTAGDVERVAVGGADLLAGAAMGPWGVVDSMTGGHGSGLIKGGAESLVSLANGDVDAMGRTAEGLKDGKHGVLAQGVAHVGDGLGTGLAAGANWLMGGNAPPDLNRTVEGVTYQENMNRMDAEFADGDHGRAAEGQDIDAQHARIMDAVNSLGGGAIDDIARECGIAPSQIVQIMRAKGVAGW
jgi:hypothetical protein